MIIQPPRRLAAFLAAAVSATAMISAAHPAAAAPLDVPSHGSKYVALGSSYAAGGALTPADPLDIGGVCGRSTSAYPTLVAQALNLQRINVSCGGATTENITNVPQRIINQTGIHTVQAQIQAVGEDTGLVTVTIGGNDVQYVGNLMAQSCLDDLASNPDSQLGNVLKSYGVCNPPTDDDVMTALGSLETKLTTMVNSVQQKVPHARVLLVDYLTVLPQSGATCDVLPITKERQKFLLKVAQGIDLATRHAAQRSGAELVAVSQDSRNHDVCSREPWTSGYDVLHGYNMMHPNEAGQAAAAAAVIRQLTSPGAAS